MTTLYFETAQTDVLREPGFSKDGKTAESQVVLGLLVSEGGYPLSYSLFNGSQYEGFTMIPMRDEFKQRFNLEISNDIEVVISEEKIAEDCQWDGLKGYITNTDLDAERVIAEYHGLWVVERAFRISKGALEMHPMFHFTERRIEAHVCISF